LKLCHLKKHFQELFETPIKKFGSCSSLIIMIIVAHRDQDILTNTNSV
jgi:hypothetical protein